MPLLRWPCPTKPAFRWSFDIRIRKRVILRYTLIQIFQPILEGNKEPKAYGLAYTMPFRLNLMLSDPLLTSLWILIKMT